MGFCLIFCIWLTLKVGFISEKQKKTFVFLGFSLDLHYL